MSTLTNLSVPGTPENRASPTRIEPATLRFEGDQFNHLAVGGVVVQDLQFLASMPKVKAYVKQDPELAKALRIALAAETESTSRKLLISHR